MIHVGYDTVIESTDAETVIYSSVDDPSNVNDDTTIQSESVINMCLKIHPILTMSQAMLNQL